MRALVAYFSYSGNTKEVAELIADYLTEEGFSVQLHLMEYGPPVDFSSFDLFFVGTFTWDYGAVPEEVRDFVLDFGKRENVAVFGTGDTQFGGEAIYCRAVDLLVQYFNSPWEGLKIEQSPRGSQEKRVRKWMKGVLKYVKSFA